MKYFTDVSLTWWLTSPKPLLVSGDDKQSQTGAMFSDQSLPLIKLVLLENNSLLMSFRASPRS